MINESTKQSREGEYNFPSPLWHLKLKTQPEMLALISYLLGPSPIEPSAGQNT